MPAKWRNGIFCALAFASAALAQTEPQSVVTPQDLVKELEERNPAIRAARYRYEAATKRPSQAGTLPEPRVSVTNFGVGHPFSPLNASNFAYEGLGVSQELPFPGKLALAAEEAKREADSEGQMYRSVVLDQTSRLKVAYFDWLAASKAIEITEKNRGLLERFEEIARTRYSVGQALQQDVLKAQVEISTLAQDLEMLQEKRARAEAGIAFALGRPEDFKLGRPAELKPTPFHLTLDALIAQIQSSPEIRAQQNLVDSRAVGVNRSRKEYRPDFGVNFQWQHTGSRFPDFYMATAEVKLPIFYARKQRYAVEESVARLHEARENYEAKRQEAIFAVKEQYLAIQSSERVLAIYDSGVLPQASLSIEATTAAYEVGKVDFLNVLSSLTNVLNLGRRYYDELARHEQALARLEPLIGHEL